jgi:hypothetical protein
MYIFGRVSTFLVLVGQGCTNPGRLVVLATEFYPVAPNIFSIITAVFSPLTYKNVYQLHAPGRKRQVTVTFTGHCTVVGPQYGTFFMSHFWRLEFGGVF